ncbi:dynamin family protein [Thiorhodospira sibirica]|uniref:dynamin family protein n=1 Tax=Thiorhodospira sibirica TaxID=154347 RepID=UPI00022C5E19|nr:dynamin family protein [Thiorhodospira sibirica]
MHLQHDTDRHHLLATFAGLAEQFAQAKADIAHKEQHIDAALQRLEKQLSAQKRLPSVDLKNKHPVMQAFEHYHQQFQNIAHNWQQQVKQYERNTAFRKGLGDAFLLYVYGKVNSGKSSLGNYVATGSDTPDTARVQQCKAESGLQFGLQEVSSVGTIHEDELQQGFGVDRKECTCAIQYFLLPGLNWVDSPGLHSKNPKNGDLAREYANSADLIVYTMSAANPARQSDMHEIEQLLSLGKPLMILITRSDTTAPVLTEHGEVEYQTVMFSEADQQAQIQYVRDELERLLAHDQARRALIKAEIVPVSVKVAQAQNVEISGMGRLFAVMCELTQKESVQMKLNTPKNNLAQFILHLQASTTRLEEGLAKLAEVIADCEQGIEEGRTEIITTLQQSLNIVLNQAMQQYQGDNKALLSRVGEHLNKELARVIENKLREQLEQLDQAVQDALDFSDATALPGFEQHFETISYSNSASRSALGGLFGAVVGGVAGFLIGGPMGAAIGSTLGSAAGGMGGKALSEQLVRRIPNGDNREQIENTARELFTQGLIRAVDTHYTRPAKQAYVPIQQRMLESQKALQQFKQALASLSMSRA